MADRFQWQQGWIGEARAGVVGGTKGRISIFGFSRSRSIATDQTSLDDLDVEPVPGFYDVDRSRASGGDVRACGETQERHNNQSAVDATTPLFQMILGDGGGGRGALAMAPGHPGAVDTRVGDVRARPRMGKRGAAWETSAPGHRTKGRILIFGFSRYNTPLLDDPRCEAVRVGTRGTQGGARRGAE